MGAKEESGKIEYHVLEYKSPNDELSIDDFYMVLYVAANLRKW